MTAPPPGDRSAQTASAALVGAAQSGDRDSLNRLLASVQLPLYQHIRSIVADADLAADVLQDTLLNIWRKLHSLRDPRWFRAWAYRIATREAVRKAKGMRKSLIVFDSEALERIPAPGEVESLFDADLVGSIEGRLASLSPASQIVLRMHYIEELTYAEIAEALEISIGTVKSRLSYGLASMKRGLITAENAKNDR